jgi:hypothetical protein
MEGGAGPADQTCQCDRAGHHREMADETLASLVIVSLLQASARPLSFLMPSVAVCLPVTRVVAIGQLPNP